MNWTKPVIYSATLALACGTALAGVEIVDFDGSSADLDTLFTNQSSLNKSSITRLS